MKTIFFKNRIHKSCVHDEKCILVGKWNRLNSIYVSIWPFPLRLSRKLLKFLAATNVLRINIVTVIGPTPPGTGVIWPATFRTSAQKNSKRNWRGNWLEIRNLGIFSTRYQKLLIFRSICKALEIENKSRQIPMKRREIEKLKKFANKNK